MENNSIKLNEKAEQFFLYEYFGIIRNPIYNAKGEIIVQEDNNESAATKCAYRAYLDMCRTLNYKEESDPNRSFCIKCICSRMANILCTSDSLSQRRDKAYELLTCDDQVQECFIDKLKQPKASEDSPYVNNNGKRSYRRFYYGQASKWINMTIKYMWLIGILEEDSEDIFEIPIDSIVMKAAFRDFQMMFPRDNKTYNVAFYQSGEIDFKRWNDYSPDATMPWSKLEQLEYESIQSSIKSKTNDNPINWECDAWIAQAVLDEKEKNK